MFSSKDQELFQFRAAYGLSQDVRFFLAEHHDANLYYYGALDPRQRPQRDAVIAGAEAAAQLGRAEEHDPALDLSIAERCVERSGSTRDLKYWLTWIQLVRRPAELAEKLRGDDPAQFPSRLDDLATLLHVVPQSCQVGVMKDAFATLTGCRGGRVQLGADAPWTSLESTLSLLRPLEYLFRIGNPEARQAAVHVLYGPAGFFLGTILNFSSEPLSPEVREELERLLESLSLKELADSLRAGNGDASLFATLASCCHRALPIHSALHWTEVDKAPRLSGAFGLPWQKRTTAASSVMASAAKLTSVRPDCLDWLALRVKKMGAMQDRNAVRSTLGQTVCESLPGWDFVSDRTDPVGPAHCVTLVSPDRREALQLLLARMSDDVGTDRQRALKVHGFIEMARLLALEVSSEGRYTGRAVDLPKGWVYNSSTSGMLVQTVNDFRRAWAGVQGARAPVLVLLCGEPGTGKSWLAENWLAREIIGDKDPLKVSGSDLKDKDYGQTEKKIREALRKLCCAGPRALIIDEIGQLSQKPTGDLTHFTIAEAFKNELGAVLKYAEEHPRSRIALIGTTNYFEDLDPGIKARFRAITFQWSHDEFRRLVQQLVTLPWSEEAHKLLLESSELWRRDPRRTADLILIAQGQAKDFPGEPFGGPRVGVVHVRAAIAALPPWDRTSSGPEATESVADAADLAQLTTDLAEVLKKARDEKVTEDEELFPLVGAKGINKNNLRWIKKYFRRWAEEYERTKRENRMLAEKEEVVEVE
jgi:hypothetical protein